MQQSWTAPLGPPIGADGSALASSVTLTDISPGAAALWAGLTEPGGSVQVGSKFRVTAFGKFSNTATPTLLLGLYYGGVAGTALAASTAVTTTTGATNWPWRMELTGKVTAIGSSGAMEFNGILYLPTSLTAMTPRWIPEVAIAPVTVDLSVAKLITVGAQWGTSSASNTITCADLTVEQIA